MTLCFLPSWSSMRAAAPENVRHELPACRTHGPVRIAPITVYQYCFKHRHRLRLVDILPVAVRLVIAISHHSQANMLPTLARRIGLNPFAAPKVPAINPPYFPYTWETNPYVCKRTWPPEFSKLSQKHQFKLERRYRRRAKLAYARPNWHKMVKLAQWGSILFVSVYGILFMELTDGNTPFSGVSWTGTMLGCQGTCTDYVQDSRMVCGTNGQHVQRKG